MKKWTFENTLEEARKFKTKTEWQKKSKGSYLAAIRNKWTEQIYSIVNFDMPSYDSMRLTEDDINKRLPAHIRLKHGTFKGMKRKATFVDEEYGEYECIAEWVVRDGRMHPDRLKKIKRSARYIPLEEIKERLPDGVEIIPETYTKVHGKAKFKKDGHIWEAFVYNVIWNQSGPTKKWVSSPKIHKAITDFLDKNKIKYETNKRILQRNGKYPMEIDIYLPDYKVGIEIHGLYWHSSAAPKFDKYRHKEKQHTAKENGIQLLQFFEDEIKFKLPIILSIIASKIKLPLTRFKASKLEVRQLTSSEKTCFFNENHLQGACASVIGFGLFSEGTLLQAITLRKNRKYGLELARFATKINAIVEFGFSRLMKQARQWAEQNGYDTIVSYADLRFSNGKVYESNQFVLDGQTVPDMFWTDKVKRYSRQLSWSAHGKESVKSMYKIFGVGHLRYVLKIKNP